MALLVLIFLWAPALIVCAEDVFVTPTGRYYYPASSPFVRTRATTMMRREDAEAKGYKPSRSYVKAKDKEGRTPSAYQQQR